MEICVVSCTCRSKAGLMIHGRVPSSITITLSLLSLSFSLTAVLRSYSCMFRSGYSPTRYARGVAGGRPRCRVEPHVCGRCLPRHAGHAVSASASVCARRCQPFCARSPSGGRDRVCCAVGAVGGLGVSSKHQGRPPPPSAPPQTVQALLQCTRSRLGSEDIHLPT